MLDKIKTQMSTSKINGFRNTTDHFTRSKSDIRAARKQYNLVVNGREYVHSPGQKTHDKDYFHHYDKRSSFGEDYANERASPDTFTKVTMYDPVKHMNKLASHDFKEIITNTGS